MRAPAPAAGGLTVVSTHQRPECSLFTGLSTPQAGDPPPDLVAGADPRWAVPDGAGRDGTRMGSRPARSLHRIWTEPDRRPHHPTITTNPHYAEALGPALSRRGDK
jgi:hypothetical protein